MTPAVSLRLPLARRQWRREAAHATITPEGLLPLLLSPTYAKSLAYSCVPFVVVRFEAKKQAPELKPASAAWVLWEGAIGECLICQWVKHSVYSKMLGYSARMSRKKQGRLVVTRGKVAASLAVLEGGVSQEPRRHS